MSAVLPALQMADKQITEKVLAIVQFGPADPVTDGTKAGTYYQVTIDPNMTSPSGKFIRFGMYAGDEIQGWQRVAAMTISEILGGPREFATKDATDQPVAPDGYEAIPDAAIAMRAIEIQG